MRMKRLVTRIISYPKSLKSTKCSKTHLCKSRRFKPMLVKNSSISLNNRRRRRKRQDRQGASLCRLRAPAWTQRFNRLFQTPRCRGLMCPSMCRTAAPVSNRSESVAEGLSRNPPSVNRTSLSLLITSSSPTRQARMALTSLKARSNEALN